MATINEILKDKKKYKYKDKKIITFKIKKH